MPRKIQFLAPRRHVQNPSFLLEEKTEQFDQSVSWNLLNDLSLFEEECTRKLMAEYNRLHREVLKMEDLLK